jgi:hypothetical protein
MMKGVRSARWAAWSLTILAFGCTLEDAADIEGVMFRDRVQAGSTSLALKGVGLARYLYTIKVYVAALYLPEGTEANEVLGDIPKRLELQYFQNIKAGDFAKAADQVLPQNVPPSTVAALRPRITRFHAWYQDIKPGDRYSLTYVPGQGTELAHNGVSKGVMEGADFAAAYFAIWLGPDPINNALREGLLGNR